MDSADGALAGVDDARGRRLTALPDVDAGKARLGPRPTVIDVVFCADRHFLQHAAVAAVSMLENSPNGRFRIHYVTCDRAPAEEMRLARTIARYPQAELAFHRVDEKRLSEVFADRHVTRAAYLRFLAPEALPVGISRIVYLDCDVVVVDDISELAATDLAGRAVAAAPDADWTRGAPDARRLALGMAPDHVYVLSGVLVMDLDRWRRGGLTARILDCARRLGPRLTYHDQDALNVALGDEIALFDKRWNLQALAYGRWIRRNLPEEHRDTAPARRRPGVIHYSTPDKPWRFRSCARRRALYFRYLAMTEWRGARPPLPTRAARLEYDLARRAILAGFDVYALPHGLGRLGAAARKTLGRGARAPTDR